MQFKTVNELFGISPPAARLCTKAVGVLVSSDKINKVIEHSDALVGHSGGVSCSESPPLPPAWVEHLKQVLTVCEGAGGEHPPKAQYAMEGRAWKGEGGLHNGLPDLLLVVPQGSRHRILQRTLLQSTKETLQHLFLHQTETHSIEHLQIVLQGKKDKKTDCKFRQTKF